MRDNTIEFIKLVARLHRDIQEMIKVQLENEDIRDLNAAQALILLNLQEHETSVGALMERGYYAGSNVSYNVRKMVERGYIEQRVSDSDRRSLLVKPSARGLEVCEALGGALVSNEQYKDLARQFDRALRDALVQVDGIIESWKQTGS